MSTQLNRKMNSFFAKVPIQRENEFGGFSGKIQFRSLKKMYSLIQKSLNERNLLINNQVFLDCGCGEGYAIIPFSLFSFKCVFGIDNNRLALNGLGAFLNFANMQESIKQIQCAFADLTELTSIGSTTIVYLLNLVFPMDLNIHLLKIFRKSPFLHTLILSKRSFQACNFDDNNIKYWENQNIQPFNLFYGKGYSTKMLVITRPNWISPTQLITPSFKNTILFQDVNNFILMKESRQGRPKRKRTSNKIYKRENEEKNL